MAKKVPAIRFTGFTDDWEQRKLDDFVKFFSGLTYTPNDLRKSGTLVLRSSNVKNGEIIDADNVYVDPNVINSENVEEGDIIVVVRNGSRALIGKHAEIKGVMPNTVIGAFMTGIRSEHSSFLNALLNTSSFEKEVSINMGATINQITGYMFSKMEFYIPKEKEQDAIGDYFKQLDNLITLHQRKLLKLKNIKKAMLEKMFPKDGSNVPEIRFDGFTDAWEQRELGEIAPLRGGFAFQSSSYCVNGVPIIRISNILPDGTVGGEFIYYNEQVDDKNFLIHKDSALLAMSGATTGKVAVLNLEIAQKYYQNQRVGLFTKCEGIDYSFVSTIVRSELFLKQLKNVLVAGAQPNVSSKNIDSFKFKIPQLQEEQNKIGNFFTNLDNLITLHQRKLDKLQNVKKACLEKMFV